MSSQNSSPVCNSPGIVLIINCVNFHKLEKRTESIYDVNRLKELFYVMQFSVKVINDPRLEDIHREIRKFALEDFTQYASLQIILMSHGDKDDKVYCQDEHFNLNELLEHLAKDNGNKSLEKIPKYVMVEACKGNYDENKSYLYGFNTDAESSTSKDVPNLIGVVLSSFEGFVSYMDKDGSPFIKCMCEILTDYCNSVEDISYWEIISRITVKFAKNSQQSPTVRPCIWTVDTFKPARYFKNGIEKEPPITDRGNTNTERKI